MKKFINPGEDLPTEIARGVVSAWGDRLQKLPQANVIVRKVMTLNKVGIIIGNGSGHEPACIGFVGEGMLDANAYGGIFAAADPITLLAGIKSVDAGAGVCLLVSSHSGDILNAKMAVELASDEGINVQTVLLYDDISSAPKGQESERRGTAGTFFSYKIVGSYSSEAEATLEKVMDMAKRVRDNTRTLTVASVAGTSPLTGKAMFEIPNNMVDIGIGVHGEMASNRVELQSANQIATMMTKQLIEDKPYKDGEEVLVLVNGCGQTTWMELVIFYHEVATCLQQHGITPVHPAIGSFITVQEMGGIALSICKVDEELKRYWTKPTDAPAFPHV